MSQLRGPPQKLISLLSDEAAQQDEASLPPEYCDYLGDLVQAVSFLRDTRSVAALFSFLNSGNMVEDALAALGDEPLARVQAILESPVSNDPRRTSAVRVLRKMAQPRNLQRFSDPENSRAAIKTTLVTALAEPVYFSRIEAVWGLAELGDKDTVALIENIAQSDAYSDTHPNIIGLRYPVRAEAQKALKVLENK